MENYNSQNALALHFLFPKDPLAHVDRTGRTFKDDLKLLVHFDSEK
jgi:hypothetical protein